MSINFIASGNALYTNSSPVITARPFTWGCWAYLADTSATHPICSLGNVGLSGDWYDLEFSSGSQWNIGVVHGAGTVDRSSPSLTGQATTWTYVIGRYITSTNDRLCVYDPVSGVQHAQRTAANTPNSVTAIRFSQQAKTGSALYFEGLVAEWWMTNTDIQPDGGQLENELMMKLAFEGPFSVPHIAKDIQEYHSFRFGFPQLTQAQDHLGDNYYGGLFGTLPTYVRSATTTPTMGPHSPLPSRYIRPHRTKRLLVV